MSASISWKSGYSRRWSIAWPGPIHWLLLSYSSQRDTLPHWEVGENITLSLSPFSFSGKCSCPQSFLWQWITPLALLRLSCTVFTLTREAALVPNGPAGFMFIACLHPLCQTVNHSLSNTDNQLTELCVLLCLFYAMYEKGQTVDSSISESSNNRIRTHRASELKWKWINLVVERQWTCHYSSELWKQSGFRYISLNAHSVNRPQP